MPSLQATLFNWYLAATVKRQPFHEWESQQVRDWFQKRELKLLPKGVSIETVDAPNVKGEWHLPESGAEARTLLYLHGGGYIFGSARMYRPLTCKLALEAEADVFSLNYRLAHEHPCPAAIEDAVAGYEWLLAQGKQASSIIVGGDSAGGGLALVLLQTLRAKGAPLPAGALLYSPWTDLACTGNSVSANAKSDVTFNEETVRGSGKRYAGALSLNDPRVSPLYGDFAGLPPLLIFASTSEIFHDDARRTAERAKSAEVEVELVERPGLPHIWPLYNAILPEAREAVRRSAAFIRERTSA